MAYFIRKNTNNIAYGIVIFTVDEESDIQNLPRYHTPGSEAYVIATGNKYVLNNSKEWILSKGGSSEGGGGSSGGGEGGTIVVNPTPININIGEGASAETDSSGNVNITIKNKINCCGGGSDEDLEWDDLADGQEIPSDDDDSSGGGCCRPGEDIYWEGLTEPTDPDPEPEPEPTPDTVLKTLSIQFPLGETNSSGTYAVDLTDLVPGTAYKFSGNGEAYYQGTKREEFTIDSTLTIPTGHDELIIPMEKSTAYSNILVKLVIRKGFDAMRASYNSNSQPWRCYATLNLTISSIQPSLNTARPLRATMKPTAANARTIVEQNEYYTIYDDGGER